MSKWARYSYCPICGKDKKHGNKCFSVCVEEDRYLCFAKNKSGKLSDLGTDDFGELLSITDTENTTSQNFNQVLLNNTLNLTQSESVVKYLKEERKLTRVDIFSNYIRTNTSDEIVVPIGDFENDCIGLRYRGLDKSFRAEKGSQFTHFIGWHHVQEFERLYIFEGEIDLLTALEAGITNAVSLPCGAGNLKCIEYQKEWLKKFKEIVICTDNDAAGDKARDNIVKMLADTPIIFYKLYLEKKKDINEVLQKFSIEKVKDFLLNKPKLIKNRASAFYRQDNSYYLAGGEQIEKLTDFTIELQGYSNNYLLGYATDGQNQKDFKCKWSDITTIKGITEHFGLFLGSSSIIPKFLYYIKEENREKYINEINHYGIIDDKFYDISSDVICDRNDLITQPIFEIKDLKAEELDWLKQNLVYMRSDTNQSLLGLCWVIGRLHNLKGAYPILEVGAITSSGKSEFVEFLIRLSLGSKENIKVLNGLTNHQIRSLASYSNTHCWAIDEVKITNTTNKELVSNLYGHLRAVYDNKMINQGTTTNKLNEFYLCTPLIISGETKLNDVSIRNRMICTNLNKHNKGDYAIYTKLKTTDLLEKLGKHFIKDRLENGACEPYQVNLDMLQDDRQKHNIACILKGLTALKKFWKYHKK